MNQKSSWVISYVKDNFVKVLKTSAIFVSATLLVGGFFVANAQAATINVPTDQPTIQAAITAAGPGDIINVAPGTYTENLNIATGLTINGAGAGITTINATAASTYGIYVQANNVTLQNFTLVGPHPYSAGYGIKISGSSNTNVNHVTVDQSQRTGVDLNGVNGATIDNVTVTNSANGNGLSETDSNNVHFSNITTSGNAWGGIAIYVKGQFYPGGSDNTIIDGVNSFGESTKVYTEVDNTAYHITNVHVQAAEFPYYVSFPTNPNGPTTVYFKTQTDAVTAALTDSAHAAIHSVADGNMFVAPGLKIQNAINEAATASTINIAAGPAYVESGQIVINKNLSIVGADKATTIIKPAQDTGAGNHMDANAWILVNSGVTFNLSNVTLDGSGKLINHGILSHGHGVINNNKFTHIAYNQSGPDYKGIAIELYGSDMTVSNNSFDNIGRIGVYTGFGSVATISGNTYTGKGAGNFLDYAFEVGRNGQATISGNNIISGNIGVASVDGSTSAGILVTTYFGPAQATITGNTITGNTDGIHVGYDGSDASVVVATKNNLSSNSKGVVSTHPTVDAKNNYWGTVSSTDIAANVSGNVSVTPYCATSACTSIYTTITAEDSPLKDAPIGISSDDGATLTSTPSVTFLAPVTVSISNGGGTSTVDLPQDVVITKTAGGNIDTTALGAAAVSSSSLSGLGTGVTVGGSLQWGIPTVGLTFSKPITLKIYVGNALNGTTLSVVRSLALDSGWTSDGIESPATCLVSGGFCQFQATKASYYVAVPFNVTTKQATNVGQNSVTLNGNLGIAGGTERGFQYGPSSSYGSTVNETGSFGAGDYSMGVPGLSCASGYAYRAYAISSSGTVYGGNLSFSTGSCTSGGGGGGGGGGTLGGTTTPAPAVTAAVTPAVVPASTPTTIPTPAPTPAPVPTPTPASTGQVLGASTYNFASNLTVGATGDAVSELQKRLTSEGVYNGPVTGYFGNLTLAAVKAYQAKNGIAQTGFVGALTRNSFNGSKVAGVSTTANDAIQAKIADLQAQLNTLLKQLQELKASGQ